MGQYYKPSSKCSLKDFEKLEKLREEAMKYKHDYPLSKKGWKAIQKYQKMDKKCSNEVSKK